MNHVYTLAEAKDFIRTAIDATRERMREQIGAKIPLLYQKRSENYALFCEGASLHLTSEAFDFAWRYGVEAGVMLLELEPS